MNMLVGQFAKLMDCYVVGSAGSKENVSYIYLAVCLALGLTSIRPLLNGCFLQFFS